MLQGPLADATNSPRRQPSSMWVPLAAPSPPQQSMALTENDGVAAVSSGTKRRWSVGRMQSQDTTGMTEMVHGSDQARDCSRCNVMLL